eukprot:TRINITY_DN1484_c3_g1_i1.p1 TRINITY_DN1484_c3_g1~~TRINITY_DN1484_c3_g1_i1.p1  ORF type:complete len:671 (+),score=113.32 TRINITY_DN1484_c3_g1_i1:76-2013(+)
MTANTNAQFEKCSITTKYEFWSKLESLKIDVWKLDDAEISTSAILVMSNSLDGKSDKSLELGLESLTGKQYPSIYEAVIPGTLKCHNTIETYEAVDRKSILHSECDKKLDQIRSGEFLKNPQNLLHFYVSCYADIKGHTFHWKVCNSLLFPSTLVSYADSPKKAASVFTIEAAEKIDNRTIKGPIFAIKDSVPVDLSTLTHSDSNDIASGKIQIAVYDPCSTGTRHGWTVRNIIFAVCFYFKVPTVTILGLRGTISSSMLCSYKVIIPEDTSKPSAGWDKDSWLLMAGNLPTHVTDLSQFMDDKLLAEESAKLNLSLMKWRMVPELPLDDIAAKKCLLVGSGTLGCGVARNLMKWGVFNITFIDRGNVSFSNPVRQNLFTHADAVAKKNKAVAAADACKLIYPLANTKAVEMSIPMPGHPVGDKQRKGIQKTIEEFDKLVSEHDAVFLLTDSREARWLPTMMATKHNKIAINSALGFDNYVAMRHGSTAPHPKEGKRVSCYFCQDIAEPTDTLKDRTLDQQCTVTRPGISDIAAANAVELFISTLTHPSKYEADHQERGMLGICPHQVRGSMQDFAANTIYGVNYDCCVGCSPKIIAEYEKRGTEFILEVLNDPTQLSKISGLHAFLEKVKDEDFALPSDDSDCE